MEEVLAIVAMVLVAAGALCDGAARACEALAPRWPALAPWAARFRRAVEWLGGLPGLPPAQPRS